MKKACFVLIGLYGEIIAARINSSHTYDGNKAEAVYRIAADFLKEAKYLHQQLVDKSRQEGS